jgi:prepilin-type N-terminal cleavage/methylation domain-containing protein
MHGSTAKSRHRQKGFSILEMLLATVILLVGLVAVAQLVPTAILLNFRNRMDSSAMVFAQRQLDQMVDQPLSANSFTDPLGISCPLSSSCNLGDPTRPNQVVGTNVLLSANNTPVIDFTSTVTGYNFTYPDPSGTTYDVRWAVIVTGNGSTAASKRFILGVRELGGNGYFLPITLDTLVTR